MKIIFTTLLAMISLLCFAQCPDYANTNTAAITNLVSKVESTCNVKLNADTISSLNVYYYASADKSVTIKFELLKAKKEVGDTAVNIPSKVVRIEIVSPNSEADKIFADMKAGVKSCGSFKVKKASVKYAGETAEIKSLADNKKRILIY